jgi:hypothetical protein
MAKRRYVAVHGLNLSGPPAAVKYGYAVCSADPW